MRSTVPAVHVVPLQVETAATRAAALLRQAQEAADDHIREALNVAVDLERLAEEIAAGGETYPPGIRAAFQRQAAELRALADHVTTIQSRRP